MASPLAHADRPEPSTEPIAVEVATPARFAAVHAAWTDLVRRAAEPNVFMDPAVVAAAARASSNPVHVLLAWDGGARNRLLGVWAFAERLPPRSPLPVRVLCAPCHDLGFLATPVLDRSRLDALLDTMLDALAGEPRLPRVVTLESVGLEVELREALTRVLAARRSSVRTMRQARRPHLTAGVDECAYFERAWSSATRKKLRQHRRRLAKKGALARVTHREPQAVSAALEQFFRLEAAGWKGREGTALVCDARQRRFMHEAVADLARHGCAWIDALELDGRPVSMQIVGRSGRAAFTWKTAYDETFRDYSPGMLLLEDYTASFLADPSLDFVDSCAYDDTGFMAAWTDRRAIADVWFDVRRGESLSFRMMVAVQELYAAARELAKRIERAAKAKSGKA
jgi:CelD/BcsL family acetyltransferase involved in cellulose biosynthesis